VTAPRRPASGAVAMDAMPIQRCCAWHGHDEHPAAPDTVTRSALLLLTWW